MKTDMKPEKRLDNSSEEYAKYLLISVNSQIFAVPSLAVLEITTETKPTKLPFVPHYIAGLINVKGNVIPLINLSTYIYEGDPLPCKQAYVIIFLEGTHFALSVDKAVDEISSFDHTITHYESKQLGEDASMHVLVSGEINISGRTAYILDMSQFEKIIPSTTEKSGSGGLLGKLHQQNERQEETSLLVFQTLGERFGFSLTEVVEIIDVAAPIPVPGAPDCVQGLAMVRDDALLVLSLPVLLGKPSHNHLDGRLLVVIEREQTRYGIDISSSVNIYTFSNSRIKNSQNEQSLFSQVVIDEKDQVTAIIKCKELIPDELHYKIKELAPSVSNIAGAIINMKHILHITLNGLSYAFPLDYVRMVSPFIKITTVSDATRHICGVIEIEGRIISVLDVNNRLGYMDIEQSQPQFVVIGDGDVEWAVPVSFVNQIIEVPEMDIEAIDSTDLKHLSGIAHYQGQLIPVINPRELYASER